VRRPRLLRTRRATRVSRERSDPTSWTTRASGYRLVAAAAATTTKDKTRDKSVARALGPDVVDDKGQRVPFSRRGWEQLDSDDNDDDEMTTAPRASRPAKPGLPVPLTIVEDDYVIVDNGAANPGELAIGRVRKVDEELVKAYYQPSRRSAETGGCPTRRRPLWRGLTGKQSAAINANARPNVFRQCCNSYVRPLPTQPGADSNGATLLAWPNG
jgi:hypothetical protein